MKSDLPKVLYPVCGRPMVHYVLDTLDALGVKRKLIVVGYRGDDVRRELEWREGVEFVEQSPQLGTGHAVMVCRESLRGGEGAVLVLTGDSPLAQRTSLEAVIAEYSRERPACVLGTLIKADPSGLGRIVRDPQGRFLKIVEERDADEAQKRIAEVNMSTYVFDCPELLHALDCIDNKNRQGEYYLTDCPGVLQREGKDVRALPVLKPCEALSINTLEELALVEAEMQKMGYKCEN